MNKYKEKLINSLEKKLSKSYKNKEYKNALLFDEFINLIENEWNI